MHRAWWVAGGAARRNGAISWPLTCEVIKRVGGHGRAWTGVLRRRPSGGHFVRLGNRARAGRSRSTRASVTCPFRRKRVALPVGRACFNRGCGVILGAL